MNSYFKKDYFIEIFLTKDVYSKRKLYNLYLFLQDGILIYDIKKVLIILKENFFEIKITSIQGIEQSYKQDSKDKNDTKIYKFLKKFIEKSDSNYNIVISNVKNVYEYKDIDFLTTELFRIKFKQTEEGYEYEYEN